MTTQQTLSLGQIARLCHVKRAVATMWLKRPVAGAPFPSPSPTGRYAADEVLDWLERTGRGNNPQPRLDLALETTFNAGRGTKEMQALTAMVAARSIVDCPLASMDTEDLLDAVEEADPDDDWLWSEVEALDVERLSHEADALVEAAWTTSDAHDRLVQEVTRRTANTPRLAEDFVALVSTAAKALLSPGGELVDVNGTANDVLVNLMRDEDLQDVGLVLPGEGAGHRMARQRLAVRHLVARTPSFDDDWQLAEGSVILARLESDVHAALDDLDQLSLQLAPGTRALVIGPAQILVDPLGSSTSRRDAVLRDHLVRAVVRLPQGLLADGARGHLALWLMDGTADARPFVGDLSGTPLNSALRQRLLDDLVAVAQQDSRRCIELLHPVALPSLLTRSRSLVTLGQTVPVGLPSAPGDDAAKIQQLLTRLTVSEPSPMEGITARVATDRTPSLVVLGELAQQRLAKVVSGTRLNVEALPVGSSRLWTAAGLARRAPQPVDMLQLTRQAPEAKVTQPGDVVFCSTGKPVAQVDDEGSAVVAYPARVLRLDSRAPISPRSVAAVINELPAGCGAWRTWQVPIARDRRATDDTLALLERCERQLQDRQNVVDELRRVVMRCVPCGAVTLTTTEKKEGQ